MAGPFKFSEAIPDDVPDHGRNKSTLPPRKPLLEYGDIPPNIEKTLLGDRYLCREGGMLFVGPSGIGKSSASIQQDLCWSIGEPAFAIRPARPLKIVGIQAEDDPGDLSEFISGAKFNLKLSPEKERLCRENCFYYCSKDLTGHLFLQNFVRPILERDHPDILRLNPLQVYLGGDVKDTALVSAFLRNGLNPLLEEFQCAAIITCHTPKTNFRTTDKWKYSDWQYAVAGAADITNWARAILVAEPTHLAGVFKFIAAKRGQRIEWENDYGHRETNKYFAHAEHSIFWNHATSQQIKTAKAEEKKPTPENVIALVSPDELLSEDDIIDRAKFALDAARDPTRRVIHELLGAGRLWKHQTPRPGVRPKILLARFKPNAADGQQTVDAELML
jgi:hypothetical protein